MPGPVAASTAGTVGDPRPPLRERIELRMASWPWIVAVAGLLALGAAVLRAGSLGPSSLWLDDAWPALVIKADGFTEVVRTSVTAPGFGFLLKGWLAVVGFSEANAQMLPFAAGVLGPPAVYMAGLRLGAGAWAALLAGVVLLASPQHVAMSGRVKQYTLEALGAALLLALAAAAIRAPRRAGPWLALGLAAAALTLVSSILAVPAWAAMVSALVAVVARRERPPAAAVAVTGAYAAFSFAYWWSFLRVAINPELEAYWSSTYVSLDGIGAAVSSAADGLLRLMDGLLPVDPVAGALLFGGAAALLAWRRPVLTLVLVSPTILALALAAAQRVPFGGGRTDPYLYPGLAILLATAVVDVAALVRHAVVPIVSIGLVVGLLLLTPGSPPYPEEDVRPLVHEVQLRAQPRDAIVIYPVSNFAFGLYTTWPIELVDADEYATGFRVSVRRPGAYVLRNHRHDPGRYAGAIDTVVADHRRVWLIASHLGPDVPEIGALFRSHGYVVGDEVRRPGATLVLWERER